MIFLFASQTAGHAGLREGRDSHSVKADTIDTIGL